LLKINQVWADSIKNILPREVSECGHLQKYSESDFTETSKISVMSDEHCWKKVPEVLSVLL